MLLTDNHDSSIWEHSTLFIMTLKCFFKQVPKLHVAICIESESTPLPLISCLRITFANSLGQIKWQAWSWAWSRSKLLVIGRQQNFSVSGKAKYEARGVPAYTQSTQLHTLIFECPQNKNVLNCEKCNKNMLTRVRSLHYKNTDFVIILDQSNRILTVFHFCFGNN